MTAKRTARTTRPTTALAGDDAGEPAAEAPDIAAFADAEQAEEELENLGAQMPEGAMLTLWRFIDGEEREFLADEPIDGFTLASVGKRWGGGKYVIYMRKPDPARPGKVFRAGSKRFKIGGAARYPEPDAATPATARGLDTVKMLETYEGLIQQNIKAATEQASMTQSMQLALLKSMTERAPDPFIELMKTLLPTLLPKLLDRGPPPMTIAETLALLDRAAAKTGPTSQLKDFMELMKTARELGGEDATPPWMGLAARGIDVIARAVGTAPSPVAAGAPEPRALPSTPEHTNVPDTRAPFFQFMAPHMVGLIRHAVADHDPETYAGLLCDMVASEHWREVLTFVQRDTFIAELCAAFPDVVPVAAWFGELRDRVIERLEEELAPALVEEPPTPDGGAT